MEVIHNKMNQKPSYTDEELRRIVRFIEILIKIDKRMKLEGKQIGTSGEPINGNKEKHLSHKIAA